ncbi:hypothetical protein ACQEVI_25665 [Promicromonospora sp. CA-289599]|uniref:hypothetical protein n=1 Tax=Promicromonospora sp. CA-289599 TaxID=3240014 RepID=UPI003D93BB20
MRKVHLIREFAPDAYEFALSSWSWIGTGDKTPRFASCFGDMFLESPDGWWFLDTVEGTLERRWSSMDGMFAELQGSDGRAEYLLEETLNAALGQGLLLGEDEVFAFLPPPAVTGTMSVSSLAPLRFAIAANLAGRIHGELNGVQPDAGASALFAAQRYAAQQAAAQAAAAQAAAQDEAAREAAAQEAAAERAGGQRAAGQRAAAQRAAAARSAQQAPAQRAAAVQAVPARQVVPAQRVAAAPPTFDAPNPQTDRWQPAAQQPITGAYPVYRPAPEPEYADAGYEPRYAAGSELDYTGGYVAPGGNGGYDYVDNSHTADSGQFSQYIADQYNTGQMAAIDHTSVPARQGPHQDGRWSYA